MSEERNNPIDESLLTNVLPLDESIIEICKTMSTEIEAHDEDLLKLSQMPFFDKLTDDRKTRYIKEFKIKEALKVFSEGKKPENISDRQWKHVMKLRFQELTRDAYKEYNLEKKKKQKEKKREQKKEKGEDAEKVIVVKEKTERVSNKIKLVIDCSFDDLMLPKEVKSMSTQITRIYNCNKLSNSPFEEILVTSFNKRLRTRFENEITSYKKWSQEGNLKFVDDDIFEDNADIIPESYIYLSADSSEELVDFEESKTYVIGGIVDKGRYKKLCYEKANKLGIKTARLPIGKYIKMHGNKVLTSLHVVQLMNEYLKNGKNWELAFDTVMPKRKVIE